MKVKIVAVQGQSALVQYLGPDDTLQRCTVPLASVTGRSGDDAEVHSDTLLMGIPYGEDWLSILGEDLAVDVHDFVADLHKYNIWTYDDLLANADGFRAALQRSTAHIYRTMIQSAKQDRSYTGS